MKNFQVFFSSLSLAFCIVHPLLSGINVCIGFCVCVSKCKCMAEGVFVIVYVCDSIFMWLCVTPGMSVCVSACI